MDVIHRSTRSGRWRAEARGRSGRWFLEVTCGRAGRFTAGIAGPRRVTALIAAGLRVVAVVGAAGLFFGRRVFSGGASWDRAFGRPVRPDEQAGRHPESPRSASSRLATGDSAAAATYRRAEPDRRPAKHV